MVVSIYRRVVIGLLGDGRNSFFQRCPLPVRRNASPISLSLRFFSSRFRKGMSLWRYHGETLVEGKNAKAVKSMLRDFGFTDSQIIDLARRLPTILEHSTKRNLMPKLKFFRSIGIRDPDMPTLFLRAPLLLSSSLENQIIPCYNCLKNVPMSKDDIVEVLKRDPDTFMVKANTVIAPNIEILRGLGMPLSSLTHFILHCTRALWRSPGHLKKSIDQALAMGLKPSTAVFMKAVYVLCSITKPRWEHKIKVFQSCGLSEDEIALAYRKNPMIMVLSEQKITRTLEFFLNKMKWAPAAIAFCPTLLELNLDKRIIPRCQVMEILVGKGLETKIAPSTYLRFTEKKFFDRFVLRYKDELPELMDLYRMALLPQSGTGSIAP